ncbi:hypothetical protein HKX48_003073 [Thoreauomyces humboldtii]|nr:hypothetical protein HKX48_003073 [Thoreauomyces humboldtii]
MKASGLNNLLAIASVLPLVAANAWVNLQVFSSPGCTGKILGFQHVDITSSFTAFGVEAAIGIPGSAPATCSTLITAAGSFGQLDLSADETADIAESVTFPSASSSSDITSSTVIGGPSVLANLAGILAGDCIPITSSSLGSSYTSYIQGGCSDASSPPALPASYDKYAVMTASVSSNTCDYASSYVVLGFVADNQPHPQLGGAVTFRGFDAYVFSQLALQEYGTVLSVSSGGNLTLPYQVTASCSGSGAASAQNSIITETVNMASFPYELGSALSEVCLSANSTNGIQIHAAQFCAAGTMVTGGGATILDSSAPTSIVKSFHAGQISPVSYGQGGLSLGVSSSASLAVQVNFSSTPVIATTTPASAFNVFYQIGVDNSAAMSTAMLNFSFTPAQLSAFGNYSTANLKWAKYDTTLSPPAWSVKSDSMVQGSSVVFNTTGFSEWTVVYAGTISGSLALAPSLLVWGTVFLCTSWFL